MPQTNTHNTADVVGADEEARIMREGRESRCDEESTHMKFEMQIESTAKSS